MTLPKHHIRHWVPALALLTFLLLTGCSYFNAFYNTSHYFHAGERERQRSTDLNAKPQEYTKAVESGGRLIELYPDSKYIDDALFVMGQSYYWLQDYHQAQRKFEELLSNYPDSPYHDQARLWLGRTYVKLKQRQKATSTLRGLIADTDDPDLLGRSLFALAELYYVDSSFVKAEEEFAKITTTSQDDKITGEAYWRAGEAAFHVGRYDQARKYLASSLKHQLTRSLNFQAKVLYGRALRESGHLKESIDVFNELLKDKRYFDELGKVRVQLGITLARQGNQEEAFDQFDTVVKDYKQSDEASQAYYEKGMVLLREAGKRDEAKAIFEKAQIEKPRSLYAMKADTMASMIGRVDNLGLSRRRILKRIDLTNRWIEKPVDPQNTDSFRVASYYDSLAIDSLHLVALWGAAYRDSVVAPPPDTSKASPKPDSTVTDTSTTTARADTLSQASAIIDTSNTATSKMPGAPTMVDSSGTLSLAPGSSAQTADTTAESKMAAQGMFGPEVPMNAQKSEKPSPDEQTIPGASKLPMETGEETGKAADEKNVIRIFDPAPVLDSLAVMRSSLQEIRFQLGEILLFDMDEPDSARMVFLELAKPPAPDSTRARATLALAYIANSSGDTTRYDSLMTDLADTYPGTEYGNYAAKELGRTPKEKPISPDEKAFDDAEKVLLTGDDYQDAYSRYRWIADTFPDSPFAPKALYASAFIAGSYLHDSETAEEVLNTLSEKYPTSTQGSNAQVILDNLNKRRLAETQGDSTSMEDEFAGVDAYGEDEIEKGPEIIGGTESLASVLQSRSLLPQEVIQGTGGEVKLRYIVAANGQASNFHIVSEDPPGQGLARALITGLEQMTFRPGKLKGEAVSTRIERSYTLPLDAPPNVRPMPRKRNP